MVKLRVLVTNFIENIIATWSVSLPDNELIIYDFVGCYSVTQASFLIMIKRSKDMSLFF